MHNNNVIDSVQFAFRMRDVALASSGCQGQSENVPERRSKTGPLNLHLVSETMVC